jgi:hypothetical protein
LLTILWAVFCGFTGPDGSNVYVAPGSVVMVRGDGLKLGGSADTIIVTLEGVVYVRETVATVIARLRSAPDAEKPIGKDN